MLIKILLILAILAGIAAIILGFTQVKPKIEVWQQKLVDETKERIAQTKRAVKAEKDFAKSQSDLKDERASHEETRGKLAKANEDLNAAHEKAKQLSATIEDLKAKVLKGEQDLAAWTALGIPVEKVKQIIADLATEKAKTEELTLVNLSQAKKIKSLQTQIDEMYGINVPDPEDGVPMPSQLKAKVLAIDPKWQLVVLDVGRNQEAKEGGNMLIYRDGKLISKVKIRTVSDNTCTATIMKGWNLVDVMEGDSALVRPVPLKVGQ